LSKKKLAQILHITA